MEQFYQIHAPAALLHRKEPIVPTRLARWASDHLWTWWRIHRDPVEYGTTAANPTRIVRILTEE